MVVFKKNELAKIYISQFSYSLSVYNVGNLRYGTNTFPPDR